MSQKLQKLSDWLLLSAIFLLPFQTRYIIEAGQLNNRPYEYTTIALYAIDLLILGALLAACLSLFFTKEKNGQWPHKTFWLLIIALLFFTGLSLFVASDRLVAVYTWSRLGLGIILAWLIIYSRLSAKLILKTILSAAVLQAILAIWQFFIQHTWSNKWLGLAAHNPFNLGVSVVETITVPVERWLRAYGSLDHPNLLGGFLGLGLIITVYLFTTKQKQDKIDPSTTLPFAKKEEVVETSQNCHCEPAVQRRAWQSLCDLIKKYNYQEIMLSIALVMITAGLFFSFSRSAILGTFFGLAILFAHHIKKSRLSISFSRATVSAAWLINLLINNFKNWQYWLITGAIIGITVIALIIPYGHLYRARVGVFDPATVGARLEVKSLDERSSYNTQAWELIKKHPLWGVGVGHYGLAISQELIPNQLSYYYQPVHNVFLLIWSEIGLGGALFWLALIAFLFFTALQNIKTNAYAPLAFALLFLPFTIMFFDHWLWSLHFGILFLWMIIGLVIKLSYYKNNL